MSKLSDMLSTLRDEQQRWIAFLAKLDEAEITKHQFDGNLSIKDNVAHLWAWQQLSIARLRAALKDEDLDFELFPKQYDAEAEDVDDLNAWIDKTYKDESWDTVYTMWKSGYDTVLELSEQIPEDDFFAPTKYKWIEGYPLFAVLEGTYDHHHNDHLLQLLEWYEQKNK